VNKQRSPGVEPCGVAHNTYGLDMRDGQWLARCGCGWRSAPSPDVRVQADELDQHLRTTLGSAPLRSVGSYLVDALPVHALGRNVLVGAVALGVTVLGGLAAWVDHDADGV